MCSPRRARAAARRAQATRKQCQSVSVDWPRERAPSRPTSDDQPDPLDPFDEIIAEETDRDPDLAVIEAGSRTLRTQGGPPEADVPARPEDPEVDKALREVEAELATRWGETKLEPSVSRIAALMDVLGDPQRSYPSIHITGTNGKTSTARMIEALLGAFELRTGRYTSPHVQSITERISLDGAPISAERFIETYQDIKPYIEMVDAQQEYRLSFFEVLTGMAYAAFADAPVGRRRRRGRHGRLLGRHQRDRRRRRRRHAHRPGPHRPARRHARARSPPRRPASSSRTRP